MENVILQGNWNEVRGKLKQKWSKLSDYDLKQIEDNQQVIFSILQKQYGFSRDEADREVKKFKESLH